MLTARDPVACMTVYAMYVPSDAGSPAAAAAAAAAAGCFLSLGADAAVAAVVAVAVVAAVATDAFVEGSDTFAAVAVSVRAATAGFVVVVVVDSITKKMSSFGRATDPSVTSGERFCFLFPCQYSQQ